VHLYFKKSVEFSYTFQFADALRDSVIHPWKLPALPLNLWKRHRIIQLNKKSGPSDSPFLFIIDYDKFNVADRLQFQPFFNSLQDAEVFIISNEHIEEASYHFTPYHSTNKSKIEWNQDLEQLLKVVIAMTKPEKLVFVGQYPYSGIMSILRQIEPNYNTAWIPCHAKDQTLRERSSKFGHLLKWPQAPVDSHSNNANNVYLSNDLSSETRDFLLKELERVGLNEGMRETSKIQFLAAGNEVGVELEEKKLIVVTVLQSEESLTSIASQSPNHMHFCQENMEYFERQVRLFFDAMSRTDFSGPRKSVDGEKAWIDIYTSF
jgi:hypothetical protein